VQNSKDTLFWMNRVGNIQMEPATSLTGVRQGNRIIWARGLVVRAAHEGVGLSRGWFATAEKVGIEIRYGAAITAILQDGRGHADGVRVRDDDSVAEIHARAVILGCGGSLSGRDHSAGELLYLRFTLSYRESPAETAQRFCRVLTCADP
jgi:tricarballylate dehydrogenase